ncbi:MAG: helix-turn-helix domain-containing protein [Candidatus Nanoarchaeia archaeon]|jgi:hypothetical protein|nr:helix-turn-helix domain-containing protein [Candidatus Nanoarchaeia archaeon]
MKSNAPRGLSREKIRELYKQGYCIEAIARKFKCQTNTITHHIYDLTIPCITMIRGNSKLTKKQVQKIRFLFIKNKVSAPKISKEFNVSQSTILNIIHGVFYRWVPGNIIDRNGIVHAIPNGFYIERLLNKKGARKPGPNKYSERLVHAGDLIPLAKKHNVSPCTISRWMRNGKMNLKGQLMH